MKDMCVDNNDNPPPIEKKKQLQMRKQNHIRYNQFNQLVAMSFSSSDAKRGKNFLACDSHDGP